jgi:hypothetical protein
MRRAWALLLGLLSVLPSGCFTGEKVHKTAWLDRMPFVQKGPQGADLVVMYVALLEVPLGDRYVNRELWDQVDEQVIALERKPILEENGWRVAQMGGIIPSRLQAMLTSDRTCSNPRRLLLHAGDTTTFQLGPELPACRFELHQAGRATAVELEKAQCAVVVKPTLTRDGRTKLQFTPQVQHGNVSMLPRATKKPSGDYEWELHEERPTETYGNLGWEVVLAPNEYVLVGARYDRLGTLGQQCFFSRDPQAPVQRLLAIKTARSVEVVGSTSGDSDGSAAPQAVPIAVQASLGSRGF